VNEIDNERVKSTSAWCNQLATSVIVVGGLTPSVSLFYGLQSFRAEAPTLAAIAYAFLIGVMLHLLALEMLEALES
jgi:hypothetical protein